MNSLFFKTLTQYVLSSAVHGEGLQCGIYLIGEGMSDTALIKELARTLRYRELPDLIGRVVGINSLHTIEEDIGAALGSALPINPRIIKPDPKTVEGAMAKYGLMDLTFQASPDLLDTGYESGLSLLKKLRFLVVGDEAEARAEIAELFGEAPNDLNCLRELRESIEMGEVIIRLFLGAEHIKGIGKHLLGKLPPDYLPREFVIKDACVTNSGFVWFHKHFYL